MILRPPSQPPPASTERYHSLAPSHLLSDPAFSADPHSNPYSTSSRGTAWASPPPAGHPVFRNKRRRAVEITTYGTGPIEEIQLIQPPNSPASHIDVDSGPQFPFPPSDLHSNQHIRQSFSNPVSKSAGPSADESTVSSVTIATPPRLSIPQPPPPKEAKKRRMLLFSRRKLPDPVETYAAQDTQAELTKPPPMPPPPSTLRDDVTQQNGRPAKSLRMVSAPIMPQSGQRPVRQARSITTGTLTPQSTAPTVSSMGSKRQASELFSGRVNDLDKIDELDETNPWGVALHHGGPYEATVKALKTKDERVPLGVANGSFGAYHNQAMKAHGHKYTPPQAPMGVSLNLKPGQILPRNFHEKRANQPPRMREGSMLPPRFQAAGLTQSNTSPTPSLYRSQSYALPSSQTALTAHPVAGMDSPGARPDPAHRRQSQPPTSSMSSQYTKDASIRAGYMRALPSEPIINTGGGPRDGSYGISNTRHSFNIPSSESTSQPPLTINSRPPPHNDPYKQLYIPSTHSQSEAPPILYESRQRVQQRSQETHYIMPTAFTTAQPRSDDSHQTSLEDDDDDDIEYFLNAPQDIGLAMLQSESDTLTIPSPQIYLPPGSSDDELDFNPYDPIHMEKDYSRSPSPLVVLYARSDRSHDSYSSYGPSRAPSSHGSSSHESHRGHRHDPIPSLPLSLPQSVPPSQNSHLALRPDVDSLRDVPIMSRRVSEVRTNSSSQPRSRRSGPPSVQLRVRNPEIFPQEPMQHYLGYQKKEKTVFGDMGGHHEDPPPYKASFPTSVQPDQSHSLSQQRRDDVRPASSNINNINASNWQMQEIPPSDDSHESRSSNHADNTHLQGNTDIHTIIQSGLQPPPPTGPEAKSTGDFQTNPQQDNSFNGHSPPMLPARRSRERIQVPTPAVSALDMDRERPRASAPPTPAVPDRDVRSLYPSSVSTASGYLRNGPPPPHRRVPKHLVMPTPLNTNPNNANAHERSYMQQPMPNSLPTPAQPTRGPMLAPGVHFMGFGSQSSRPHYPPPTAVLANRQASAQSQAPPQAQARAFKENEVRPMAAPQLPIVPVKSSVFVPIAPKSQEIVTASRKLKKRGSVMPPSAPPSSTKLPPNTTIVSTTVSFAPPVVGFATPTEVEKNISLWKTEKMTKRVLSKKRTDI